jgi:hypothetical protein
LDGPVATVRDLESHNGVLVNSRAAPMRRSISGTSFVAVTRRLEPNRGRGCDMTLGMKLGEALRVGVLVAVGVTVVGCGGGAKPMTPQCLLNSDCAKLSTPGLVCALGYCVTPCATSSDCPNSERCVVLSALSSADGSAGADAGVAQGTACQAPELATCNYTSMCKTPLVCSADHQCRDQCETNIDCPMGQFCTSVTHLCADPSIDKDYNATINDFVVGTAGTGGSAGTAGKGGAGTAGTGGSTGTAGKGGGGTGASGTQCPSAQTQFGLIAQGDSNPGFTSSVGVRTATQLLVFSGYNGPDPSADGGAGGAGGGGGGGNVNRIYWQAFDPTTAKNVGPAKPLVLTDSTSVGYIYLDDVSIAPTGEIAVLYTHIDPVQVGHQAGADGLSVAFLAPPAQAGSSGPQVQQNVQIESAQVSYPVILGAPEGQPHAIWSTFSNAFVFSWTYQGGGVNPYARVRKFLANGSAAGGDTNTVPTNAVDSVIYESGSVGTSGALFGVALLAGINYPSLTVLDALGNEVGSSLQITGPAPAVAAGPAGYYYWVATAGTARGFVYFSGTEPVTEYFVPTTPDGGVAAVADGGTATLVGGAALPGFSVTGTEPAAIGRAISDDTGGPGGVGAVLLYADGADFIYVNADGVTHVGPTTVISHAFGAPGGRAGEDEVAITEFGGSFGVSLYSAAEHLTRMAASGCMH